MKTQLGFMDKMKIRYNFAKLVQNPTDTQRIFYINKLVTSTADPEYVEKVLKHAFSIPRFHQMWKERYCPQIPKLKDLAEFPKKSFGHEFYLHMTNLNLDPDLFPAPDLSSQASYITSRIYQAHDFWHVLTGFDTSIEQELGLQGFGVAQCKAPMSSMIIAGGLLHLLGEDPLRVNDAMEFVSRGYRLGLQSPFLLAEPILEQLDQPLDDIRKKYNLELSAV